MMVGGRLQYSTPPVKLVAVFLKGGDSRRMLLNGGDLDRGGSSKFFCPREVVQLLQQDRYTRCQWLPHIFCGSYP